MSCGVDCYMVCRMMSDDLYHGGSDGGDDMYCTNA